MDCWSEMALFVQVAETGSPSRAAGELGLSNAAASRHLSALEERPGVRLVARNTRWGSARAPTIRTMAVNLAYPSRKHLGAKVRTFIDFMAEHFDRMDHERKWTTRFGFRAPRC